MIGSRSASVEQNDIVEESQPMPKANVRRRTSETSGRPNVLIILWDTVRADRLSIYGGPRETTPFLQRLAKSSMVFERAISPAMWTVPSHASLFTGLAVREHGATFKHRQLDRRFQTMAEYFSGAGYQTYAFSANPNLNQRSIGLLQGFDTIEQSWSKELGSASAEITAKKLIVEDKSTEISPGRRGSGARDEVFFNAGPIARKTFRRWLKERESSEPFLAYINMMEAHKPRVPSMRTREAIIEDSEMITLGLETPVTEREHIKYMLGLREYTAEEKEAISGVYDSSLRELDMATHGILEDLRVRDLLDNTIVVLVSDHGEALGEHQLFAHKYGLYDELVRVPLLIRYPEKVERGRVTRAVSTQHLYSTLIDLAGIKRPKSLPSVSLLDDADASPIVSEIVSTNREKYGDVLERSPKVEPKVKLLLRTAVMVEQDRHKLISYEDGERELYDLRADPHELNNVADENPARVDELMGKLSRWEQTHRKTRADNSSVEEVIAPDGDEKELLHLLGYVE